MRDFKGMKRQRGRNRGGGNNKSQPHNANRAFDSNGPEGIKVRGNAQHVYDKYQQLARDASTGGDRVLAENYLQHAEHYFRVIRAVQPARSIGDIIGRDAVASGYDIDFEDESGAQAYAEIEQGDNGADNGDNAQPQQQPQQNQNQQPRRDDRNRYENRPRDDRPRDDRPREDRPRDERPKDRDDRPRERFRDRDREERRPREDRNPMAVIEPEATPLPRADKQLDHDAPRLRSSEGDESHAPAFLRVGPRIAPEVEVVTEAETPKPRRRRTAKTAEA